MANKVFHKYFSVDYEGINAECSAIEQEGPETSRSVNLEWAPSNNLRGRTGCQLAALPGGFYGLFSHTYTRTQPKYLPVYKSGGSWSIDSTFYPSDGSTVNELVALNTWLWVLDSLTFTITVASGSNNITWYTYSTGGAIHLVIKQNSVTILDYNCGDGTESLAGGFKTLHALLLAIDALATLGFTITRNSAPPFAIVNGDQTVAAGAYDARYGYPFTINVDAGHTFAVGDPLCFQDYSTTYQGMLRYGWVTAVAAGTVTFAVGVDNTSVVVLDNQVLGYLCNPAAAIPITTARTTTTATFPIVAPYWRALPSSHMLINGFWGDGVVTSGVISATGWKKPVAASSGSGNLFIAYTPNPSKVNNPPLGPYQTASGQRLLKYDGQGLNTTYRYDAGMSLGAAGGGGAMPAGTYKYKVYAKYFDAQGNIVEHRPSATFTTGLVGAAGTQALTINYFPFTTSAVRDCALINMVAGVGPAAAGTAITIDGTAGLLARLHVGDPVVVSAYTYSAPATILATPAITTGWAAQLNNQVTLSISSAIPALSDNAPISAGLSIVLLRTTANGNTFYYHSEWPNNPYATNITITDGMNDTVLSVNAQWADAEIGKEHDGPPVCSLVCGHQGGLVTSGDPTQPNTVSFSTASGEEYFPLASNSFDISSQNGGPVTAIASDSQDRLAVFKERAYFDVSGDLDSGAFAVQPINEGDYGIPSQASIARNNGMLIGVSTLGLVGVKNGALLNQPFRKLNARMIDQTWKFNWASGINAPGIRSYLCSIPVSGTINSDIPIYVLDYSRPQISFSERAYGPTLEPSASFAVLDNVLYHMSFSKPGTNRANGIVYRSLERFDGNSPTGDDGESFVDHTTAINYVFESQPINFGEPSILKTPIRLRLYSIPNDYIAEQWVPFSTLVETSIFPDAAYFGGSNPGALSSTLTFSTSHDFFKDVKLPNNRCFLYMVRFTTNLIKTAPFITGYEIVFSESYAKEDLVK